MIEVLTASIFVSVITMVIAGGVFIREVLSDRDLRRIISPRRLSGTSGYWLLLTATVLVLTMSIGVIITAGGFFSSGRPPSQSVTVALSDGPSPDPCAEATFSSENFPDNGRVFVISESQVLAELLPVATSPALRSGEFCLTPAVPEDLCTFVVHMVLATEESDYEPFNPLSERLATITLVAVEPSQRPCLVSDNIAINLHQIAGVPQT